MSFSPLKLSLEPIIPIRRAALGAGSVRFGYTLRLADGFLLSPGDSLFRAFAMEAWEFDPAEDQDAETLQHKHFSPGSSLCPVLEPLDDDGDDVAGVWDHERVRRIGQLMPCHAARIAAAVDYGMPIELMVISERRTMLDNRRVSIELLIYSPALAQVGPPPDTIGPERTSRRRLVLFADGPSELRWWDPTGSGGPAAVDELPLSEGLRGELARVSAEFGEMADEEKCPCGCEVWRAQALNQQAEQLWRRARSELGRDYAVGFLGVGMSEPRWSPEETNDEDCGYNEVPV